MSMKAIRALRVSCVLILAILMAVSAYLPALANGVPFGPGDVFTGVGPGIVNHFNNAGVLLDALNNTTGSGVQTGMCFDAANNLYTTDFYTNQISEFDSLGNLVTATFATSPSRPESCVFDAASNLYVGGPLAAAIHEYNPAGTLINTFSVVGGSGTGGTDWVDLAADQCTMLYTGEGSAIKSYNVCTNTQNPDFASGLPGPCFALRIRPNGEVMIACSSEVVRLSASATMIQTYPVSRELFALNLDPDNTTFWTADDTTQQVFRVDIATGAILTTFNGQPAGGNGVFGVAVFHEIVVSQPTSTPTNTPVPTNTPTPTPTNAPPICSAAVPSARTLWPPNHKGVNVSITGVSDPDGDTVTTTITDVTQDEPLKGLGSGDTCPDAFGVGTSTVQLRAERDGTADGRVYHLSFTATDAAGNSCTGVVTVCVPHDQSGRPCADEGPLFNSTGPC